MWCDKLSIVALYVNPFLYSNTKHIELDSIFGTTNCATKSINSEFVRIKLLKTWYNITRSDFINIYVMISVSLYYHIYALWLIWAIRFICIIHELGVLGIAQKIQVMGSLQVDELFITSSWT